MYRDRQVSDTPRAPEMDVGSNAERQNEEVEVLQSIYSDAFTVLERAGRGMTLRIVLPLDDRSAHACSVSAAQLTFLAQLRGRPQSLCAAHLPRPRSSSV